MAHNLIIESLRDASAKCECGKWSIVFPTFDRDSDDYIRGRLKEAFLFHVDYHEARATSPDPDPI